MGAFFLGNDDAGFALLNRMTLWYQAFDGKRMARAASESGESPDSLRASQESREPSSDSPPASPAPKESRLQRKSDFHGPHPL